MLSAMTPNEIAEENSDCMVLPAQDKAGACTVIPLNVVLGSQCHL